MLGNNIYHYYHCNIKKDRKVGIALLYSTLNLDHCNGLC